jgi:hypothetical protein
MKDNLSTIGVSLFYVYFFVAHIFTFYFWFQWAQTHSFLSSLFLGPFVAEIKGLLFPFFM